MSSTIAMECGGFDAALDGPDSSGPHLPDLDTEFTEVAEHTEARESGRDGAAALYPVRICVICG